MATTTTFSPAHVGIDNRAESGASRGFLGRIFQHMLRSREAEARRRVASVLWNYSNESLSEMGLTREELARWHSGAAQ